MRHLEKSGVSVLMKMIAPDFIRSCAPKGISKL